MYTFRPVKGKNISRQTTQTTPTNEFELSPHIGHRRAHPAHAKIKLGLLKSQK